VTVTGGKPGGEGPLALKRELRDTQLKLADLERELGQAETRAAWSGEDACGSDPLAGHEIGRAPRG